jgi:hypothetical protein
VGQLGEHREPPQVLLDPHVLPGADPELQVDVDELDEQPRLVRGVRPDERLDVRPPAGVPGVLELADDGLADRPVGVLVNGARRHG